MAALLQLCQPFDHAVMAAIQSIAGSVMDKLMLFFTFLGEETFAILLLIAVYWCWDKRLGEYLLFSLYTAMSVNGLMKDLICRPRPFLNEEFSDLRYVKVKSLLVDTEHLSASWSFPSGHSQTAGSIYGSLMNGRRAWAKTAGIVVILLVMVSRVYLGVHYPTDTIVGAVLGLLCAWVCGLLYRRFYQHRILLMGAAVLLSGVMLLVSPSGDSIKTLAMGVGAVAGMWLEDGLVEFRSANGILGRVLRLVIGFAVIMGIRIGLKALLPDMMWCHALRYGLMGLFGTFVWPLVFTKMGF